MPPIVKTNSLTWTRVTGEHQCQSAFSAEIYGLTFRSWSQTLMCLCRYHWPTLDSVLMHSCC